MTRQAIVLVERQAFGFGRVAGVERSEPPEVSTVGSLHSTTATRTLRHDRALVLWTLAAMLLAVTAFADIVTVKSNDGRATREIKGDVLDYTGEQVILRHPSGREETIPTRRVVAVEAAKEAQHRAADSQFAAGDFAGAVTSYRQVFSAEPRPWVKRELLARLTRCFLYTGQPGQAGSAFVMLYGMDSTTPHFTAIPLSWQAVQPDPALMQQATRWLNNTESAAVRLLGASWLISTTQRAAALQALQRINDDPDPRVVFLAEAQLWRTQVVTADAARLAAWRTRIDRMPAEVRAGPSYLLGMALARQKQPEEAALSFMRVVILHEQQHDLHGPALLAAGRQLELLNQANEARGLYQEALQNRVSTSIVTEARSRLDALTKTER